MLAKKGCCNSHFTATSIPGISVILSKFANAEINVTGRVLGVHQNEMNKPLFLIYQNENNPKSAA